MTKRELYQEYLKTDHWRCLRQKAIETHGDRCNACDSVHGIEVHHLQYHDLYSVTPDDLMPLCRVCHGYAHKSNWLMQLLATYVTSAEKRIATKAYLVGHTDRSMQIKAHDDSNKVPFDLKKAKKERSKKLTNFYASRKKYNALRWCRK